jgi:hypothetical protein
MIYEKCRDILLEESELIQNASVIQEKIRLAVTNREWAVFEDHLNAMNEIEKKLEALENEREQLLTVFEALEHQKGFCEKLDAKGRFFKLATFLPESQRNDLTSIYHSLKHEAVKLRLANDTLMTYLSGIKATLRDFFDLAFPERSGKMYTNQGTHHSHDMRSLVINASF